MTLSRVMIDPSGNTYKEKSRGPKMEPCGTPHERGAVEKEKPLSRKKKFQSQISELFNGN